MPTVLTLGPVLKVNGTAVSADDVVDIRAERSIGAASRLTVRIAWDLSTVSPKLGDAIELSFVDDTNASTVVFAGEIVGIGADLDEGGYELVITAFDKSHRLNKKTATKTFLKQSYSDVISAMCGEVGLTAQVDSSLGSVTHPYLVQATTNFAFLSEICVRTGSEWYVDQGKLYVQPRKYATDGPVLKLGETLLWARVRYSVGEHATKVKVMGWDTAKKQAIVSEQTSTATAIPTDAAPIFTGAGADQGKFGTAELQTSTLPVLTADEAAAVAKGLGARLSTTKMIVKGESILDPAIKVGTKIKLENVGPTFTGKYYVTAVEHVMGTNRSATTRFTAGGLEPSTLVDLLGPGDHGVAPWSQLGVVIGIVTNNDQTAGDSKPGPGMVKVKFPTMSDTLESAPARLVSLDAGPQRGYYHVPEINDEVLVAFEHGDPRRPYVLGSVWNGKDKPPTLNPVVDQNKVVARQFKTRLGHTMTWNDGSDDAKKNLTIQLSDGKTTVLIGQDKIEITANNDKPIKITNGKATIELKANGDIAIKGEAITIDAMKGLTVTSKQDTEIKPSANFKVTANAGVELKGNAPCKFESSAITSIKGALVKIN